MQSLQSWLPCVGLPLSSLIGGIKAAFFWGEHGRAQEASLLETGLIRRTGLECLRIHHHHMLLFSVQALRVCDVEISLDWLVFLSTPHLPLHPGNLKDTWLYKKTTVLRSEGPICSGGVNTGPLNPSQWSGSHSFVWRSHILHTCSIGAKYFPRFTNNLSFWDLHLVFEKYNWFATSSTCNSAFAQTLEIKE